MHQAVSLFPAKDLPMRHGLSGLAGHTSGDFPTTPVVTRNMASNEILDAAQTKVGSQSAKESSGISPQRCHGCTASTSRCTWHARMLYEECAWHSS